jgi:hypothetical protein
VSAGVAAYRHKVQLTCFAMPAWLLLQEEAMERAKMKLGQAMRRLNIAYKQSRSNLMLYVVLFIVGICLLVFVLNKLRRLGRLFFWR